MTYVIRHHLFSSTLCASWHGSSFKTAYVVHSLRGMFCLWSAKLQTSAFKSPRQHIGIDCLRTKKGLQGGKTIQQRSKIFASLWSLMHLLVLCLALSAHTYVCLLVPLIFDWLPHCCSFPELGSLTQTDLSASLWLHIYMTKRKNRIGDLTRYRVS